MSSNEWFASWFDTSYYHLLYKKRNTNEAKIFIENLLLFLQLPPKSKILDLACGKGRHSKTLCEGGMDVLGVDLSEQSIQFAKKSESEYLHFKVHDMRHPIEGRHFDAIFNLFTSFGYFAKDEDNLDVLQVVHGMLRLNGLFVFDFLNATKVIRELVPKEEKEIEGVQFVIERHFDGRFIRKAIDVDDGGKIMHFEEKVRGYTYDHLSDLLNKAGFQIMNTFGSFDLKSFDEKASDRAIFICKRKLDI